MEARKLVFPKMEPWQRPPFEYLTTGDGALPKDRRAVVKAKRQVGKSVLCSLVAVYHAVMGRTCNVIVEPTLGQARRVFQQITNMLAPVGIIRGANASLLEMTFINGSMIYFKSAEQKDSLRGITVTGILIIDEAAFCPDDVIDILLPTVDANKANMLVVSTPLFTEGRFYEFTKDPTFKFFDWGDYDLSKYLSEERLEHYRKTLPEMRFRTEYLGEFISEGGYVFKSYKFKESVNQPVVVGIDFGTGSGGDYTWATFLDAYGCTTRVWYDNNLSPTQAVEVMAEAITNSGVKRVAVENNSIGAVYYDLLRQKLDKKVVITKFYTTNETKRTIIENLARAFEEDKCFPANDHELKRQLSNYSVQKTAKGYTYNGINGAHDDGVMSLAIAYNALENGHALYCVSAPRKTSRGYKKRN